MQFDIILTMRASTFNEYRKGIEFVLFWKSHALISLKNITSPLVYTQSQNRKKNVFKVIFIQSF